MLQSLLGDPSPFLAKLFAQLDKDGIDVSNYVLDHICYRVGSNVRYEEIKEELMKSCELLKEAILRERRISVFRLSEPIVFEGREIWCLELPSPRKDLAFKEGFEHVEFVIDVNFEEFMSKYDSIKFNLVSMHRETNPDIIIEYDGFAVKFHHHKLEDAL